MAVGTFSYWNSYGSSDKIENPETYTTYNIGISNGLVENQTNATVTLYSGSDCRGDSDYVNPKGSMYVSTGYQSFRFTT